MAKPGKTGIARVIAASNYSKLGLIACFKHEVAFRQELALMLVLVPAVLYFGDGGVERALLIFSLLLILITELLNSGLEAVVDRVGEEWHELAGRAKDIGSAAVFIALLNAAIIWALILGPSLYAAFNLTN